MRPIAILKLRIPTAGGGGGGGGSLDTQAVTVGINGSQPGNDRTRGFNSSASFGNTYIIGSISDGTSNVYSGAAIVTLCWAEGFGYQLVIAGTLANSGWTSITIGGSLTLTRASATFAQSGGNTSWTWNQGNAGSQSFGTSGIKNVAFN